MNAVYKIQSKATGRVYIGISSDFTRRKAKHLRELRKSIHHNTQLQRLHDKYGREDLEFVMIDEYHDRSDAIEMEIRLIEEIDCINSAKGGDGGDTISNHPRRSEIVQKVRESRKLINIQYSKAFLDRQKKEFPKQDELWGEYFCNKCSRMIKGKSNFLRYHGDNCGEQRKDLVTCPKCKKTGAKSGMVRWHFENCRAKTVVKT